MRFISNPFFLLVAGAAISFAGSVVANLLFYGKIEKSRAQGSWTSVQQTDNATRSHHNL